MVKKIIAGILTLNVVFVTLLFRRAKLKDLRNKSFLIVIDGTDGSGKATQTKLLVEALQKYCHKYMPNKKVVHLEFPNYDNTSSTQVKEYLNGDYLVENTYQSSIMYTVDRVATFIKKDKSGKSLLSKFNEGNCIYICDRYTTSNLLHQSIGKSNKEVKRFIKIIEGLEYKLCGLPKPDLVLYLDVEPEVSIKNIKGRYNGDESKEDIHENINHITEVYNNKQNVINKLKWEIIKCSNNEQMRRMEVIASEIQDKVLFKILSSY